MRSHHALCLFIIAACTEQAADPAHTIKLPPNGGVRAPATGTGQVPSPAFSFAPGTFAFTGPTAPGSASVSAAPVIDPNTDPSTYGGGAYDVTLSGTHYTGALQSLAMTVDDGAGTSYLVLGGYNIYTDAAGTERVDEVVALVKTSDFAAGATVALDGADRVALFATGATSASDPDAVGAAISGSVTFTSGSLAIGDTITASIAGDFGPIDWTSSGGGSGSGGSGSGSITAGAYTLDFQGPAQVQCDGSLVGHEADFAGITAADLALSSGAVTVATPSSAQVTVDGAAIATAFGATPLALDADPSGLFVGFTNQTGSGPDATSVVGKYFVVDPSSATPTLIYGASGAGYATADGSGTCTVSFGATLSQ